MTLKKKQIPIKEKFQAAALVQTTANMETMKRDVLEELGLEIHKTKEKLHRLEQLRDEFVESAVYNVESTRERLSNLDNGPKSE